MLHDPMHTFCAGECLASAVLSAEEKQEKQDICSAACLGGTQTTVRSLRMLIKSRCIQPVLTRARCRLGLSACDLHSKSKCQMSWDDSPEHWNLLRRALAPLIPSMYEVLKADETRPTSPYLFHRCLPQPTRKVG